MVFVRAAIVGFETCCRSIIPGAWRPEHVVSPSNSGRTRLRNYMKPFAVVSGIVLSAIGTGGYFFMSLKA